MILKRFHYALIDGDAIRDVILELENKGLYDDFEDQKKKIEKADKLSQKVVKSLYYNMQKDLRKANIGIIIDDTDLSIEECNKTYGDEDNIIYCLGTSEITPKEMQRKIMKYDTEDDWSSYIPNMMRTMLCENIVRESKENKRKCEDFDNIKYVETSQNREEVLNQIVNELENII